MKFILLKLNKRLVISKNNFVENNEISKWIYDYNWLYQSFLKKPHIYVDHDHIINKVTEKKYLKYHEY